MQYLTDMFCIGSYFLLETFFFSVRPIHDGRKISTILTVAGDGWMDQKVYIQYGVVLLISLRDNEKKFTSISYLTRT